MIGCACLPLPSTYCWQEQGFSDTALLGVAAQGRPWVLIGAVSAAGVAALVLVLALAGYWRWRARKATTGSAVRAGSWGASAPADSISSVPEEAASPHLALRESEVFIPVDATGRPWKLGEGAHGQVQP